MKSNRTALWGVLAILLTEVIYGSSYLFTKGMTDQVPGLYLLGWRFLLAFLLLALLRAARVIRVDYRGKPVKTLLAIGVLQPVVYFLCEFNGIRLTTASESGTIIACFPVVILTLSYLMLKEKPNRFQAAGIGVSLTGVLITVLAKGVSTSGNLAGYGLLAVGIVSYSIYTVATRRLAMFTPMELTYATIGVGAACFVLLAVGSAAREGALRTLITLPAANPAFLGTILYLGWAASVLAFFLYNCALAALGPNRSAAFVGVSTVVSILLGVLVGGESFTPRQAAGAALILAGVYLANYRPRRQVCPNGAEVTR